MPGIRREIQPDVRIGQLYGFSTAVDRMNELGPTAHGIHGEPSSVAKHVENRAVFGIFFQQSTVFTLVNEKPGLLSFQPIHMKFQSILNGHVVINATIEKAILLSQFGLERQGGLAFIENMLDTTAHHAPKSLAYRQPFHMHADTMRLHDGRFSITIND